MSVVPEEEVQAPLQATEGGSALRQKSRLAGFAAFMIALMWTIPTIGLFITSFRPQIEVLKSGWWMAWQNPKFTFANYSEVLFGGTTNLSQYFVNSFVITIPAVIIPIALQDNSTDEHAVQEVAAHVFTHRNSLSTPTISTTVRVRSAEPKKKSTFNMTTKNPMTMYAFCVSAGTQSKQAPSLV
jgi:hypothetical protein